MKSLLISVIATTLFHVTISQNPPGVPPHHQNVVPPQQQQQQQQYQQQQVNHQQQQVNQQNQHVNQHQDLPHGHVTEGRGGDTLRFKSDVHNAAHVMEHLQEVIETKPKEQMTEEELEFHYFKMHDYDGDNKLDGVEIGKALTHFHGEEVQAKAKVMSDEEISSVVDLVLQGDDLNGDGYVEYYEFVAAQRKSKHGEETGIPDLESTGADPNDIPV